MVKILLNYDYTQYPYTTASYLEMAGKRMAGVEIYRREEIDPAKVDLVVNVMPCDVLVVPDGVKTCYWEIDAHIIQGQKKEIYDRVDKVFIAQSPFFGFYPKEKTAYLPLACEPTVHHLQETEKVKYDIGFIGNDTYPTRRRLLDQLGTKYNILRTNTPPGLPYSRALSSCKLTFNCSMQFDVNMRFFEAIAIGRLLLTDYLPEQDMFAKQGEHYRTYTDWKDLDETVAYYLSHDLEREKIAKAGSNHILRHHTYSERLREIIKVMGFTTEETS